jgi:hypothetical protein
MRKRRKLEVVSQTPQQEIPDSSAPAPRVQTGRRSQRLSGLGKILITVYLVLAIAATARSVFQIIRKFDEAPLAYSLSAVSGVVYILASVALIKRFGAWRVTAWVTLIFEFVGVVVVGTLSLTHPELFAHASVWSEYGKGYVFIPLVLPILGMIWLAREGKGARA